MFKKYIFLFLILFFFSPQFAKSENLFNSLVLQIEALKRQVLQLQIRLAELQKRELGINHLKSEITDFYQEVDDFRLNIKSYSNKENLNYALEAFESRARNLSIEAFEYDKYDSSWMMDRIAYSFSRCRDDLSTFQNYFNELKVDNFLLRSILWEIKFSISWLDRVNQIILPNREIALQSIPSLK